MVRLLAKTGTLIKMDSLEPVAALNSFPPTGLQIGINQTFYGQAMVGEFLVQKDHTSSCILCSTIAPSHSHRRQASLLPNRKCRLTISLLINGDVHFGIITWQLKMFIF